MGSSPMKSATISVKSLLGLACHFLFSLLAIASPTVSANGLLLHAFQQYRGKKLPHHTVERCRQDVSGCGQKDSCAVQDCYMQISYASCVLECATAMRNDDLYPSRQSRKELRIQARGASDEAMTIPAAFAS